MHAPYTPRRSVRLPLSQPLQLADEEAHTMGLGLTALLTADLSRYRRLADAATPTLDAWHWQLLSHVLSGIEASRILTGDDSLPSPGTIAAEIDTWADGALDDDALRAGELRRQVMRWTPLTIAGVLMRLRNAKRPASTKLTGQSKGGCVVTAGNSQPASPRA